MRSGQRFESARRISLVPHRYAGYLLVPWAGQIDRLRALPPTELPPGPRLASPLSGAFGGFSGHPWPSETEPCLSRGLNVRIRLLLAKGVPICKGNARPLPDKLCCALSLHLVGVHDAFSGVQLGLCMTQILLPLPVVAGGRRLCHLCATWPTSRTLQSCDRRPGERRLLIRDLCTLIHPNVGTSDSHMVTLGGRWKG